MDQEFKGKIQHIILDQNENQYTMNVRTEKYDSYVFDVKIPEEKKPAQFFKEHNLRLYHAPWNLHLAKGLQITQRSRTKGFVFYLDDDDKFMRNTALQEIADYVTHDKLTMIFWRVQFPSRLVPQDNFWKLPPAPKQISGIGFAHSTDLIPYHQWDEYAWGDFRTAQAMYKQAKRIYYIDEIYTGMQSTEKSGAGKGEDK